MIYKLLKLTIKDGITNKNLDKEDIQEKLDLFMLNSRITKKQYAELTESLNSYVESEEEKEAAEEQEPEVEQQ